MFYLNLVLKSFHNCTKLPICLLDNDFCILNKYGHDNITEDILNHFNITKDLKGKKILEIEDRLIYDNNMNFLFIPFLFSKEKPVFFLIGPFYTSDVDNKYNISILHTDSLKYIKHLLLHLLDDIIISCSNPLVYRAIQYIHNNYSREISIDDLCEQLNINKCYFCSLFKKETGYTFIEYLTLLRIEKSKIYLRDNNLNLLDVSLNVGFNNQAYFSTVFKKSTGQTPSEYRSSINIRKVNS